MIELAPSLEQIRHGVGRHVARKSPHLGRRAAAVLVPLLCRPDGLHLLFTERSASLKTHAGQVSFPGGSIDPTDADAQAAALREAREEVGLTPEHVEIIGVLDDCPTFVTGFVITPFVGVVDPQYCGPEGAYPWKPSPDEIARLHELPLADFLDPANRRVEVREAQGIAYELIWYTVGETVVWGATARIVRQLLQVSANLPTDAPVPGSKEPG